LAVYSAVTATMRSTGTLTTNGNSSLNLLTINCPGGTVSLAAASSIINLSLIAGTLNLNGYDLTTGQLSSSGTLTRSITFGSNNINLGITSVATGQLLYDTPGSYSWVVPTGVTSISAAVVGAGGGSIPGGGSYGGAGAGGGGLAYGTTISVTPGETLSVTVGLGGTMPSVPGTASTLLRSATVLLSGGGGGAGLESPSAAGGVGGTSSGTAITGGGAGGNGGAVLADSAAGSGGGGAGGYSGAGGAGGTYQTGFNYGNPGSASFGGGGGGGGSGSNNNSGGGAGGGVGIYGLGSNGAGGTAASGSAPGTAGGGGGGGSGGTNGDGWNSGSLSGGSYGGGGGAGPDDNGGGPGNGANGAVRIIWGGKTYPNNASSYPDSTTPITITDATNFTWTGTGGLILAALIAKTISTGSTGWTSSNVLNLTYTSGTLAPTISSGYFNTLDFGSSAFTPSATVNVNSVILSSGGTFTSLTVNTIGTGTITSNSRTLGNLTINNTGTTTLAAALTVSGTTTLTTGTLALADFTLTTATFSSSNANTRSITFGTGNITITSSLAMAIATNFTYTGTGGFTSAMAATRTFTFGTTGGSVSNAPNLLITSGASIPTITDGSWFDIIDFTGSTCAPAMSASVIGIYVDTLTLATGGTYTGLIPVFTRTQTWTSQFSKQLGGIGVNGDNVTVTLDSTQTYTATSQLIVTTGSIDLGSSDLTIGSVTSNNTNNRAIILGSNNITLATTTAGATNINIANATNLTVSGTGGFRAAADITRTFTFGTTGGSISNAPNLAIISGASVPTITTGSWFDILDFTGSTCTPAATTVNIDTLTLATGGIYTGLIPVFTRTQTWTPQFSKQLGGIGVGDSTATLTLENTQTYIGGSTLIVNGGTLNLNANAFTFYYFSSTGTGSRSITGGGSITYSGSWIVTSGPGFTGSDYTIYAQSTSFAGGGGSYGTLINNAGILTISGSNSFADIQSDPISTDPYFEYTTLLLPGEGTNTAQNNTFLDGSTNNLTVTRVGNTTQGTFTPYGANWSNYFDGTGDYLSIPANIAFAFGTSDFTVESWVYLTSTSSSRLATNRLALGPLAGTWSFSLSHTSMSFTEVIVGEPGPTATFASILNTWAHIAAVRNGGVTTLYLNGTQVAQASQTTNFNNTSHPLYICTSPSENFIEGYVSNIRIVKGTAVYTTSFTPSTIPLVAISGTSILTCQSNRLIDNSPNNFTITKNGNVTVLRFSPFSPESPYSSVSIGGSGYFDGSDYLSIANNAAFIVGANDASVELWVYSLTSTDTTFNGQNLGATSTMRLIVNGGNYAYTINNDTIRTTSIPVVLNAWIHIALTITGGTARMFVNGVLSNVVTGLGSVITKTDPYTIGCEESGVQAFLTGYMTDFRFVNGSIPTSYQTASLSTGTTIFTPPTAPLTAIANTAILLNYTNAGIINNAMQNNLETAGNAQISTLESKFGGSSMSFDGTGDYLTMPTNTSMDFGTGDFTIELWIYPTALTTSRVLVDRWTSGNAGGWQLYWRATGTSMAFFVGATVLLQDPNASNISLNSWTYVAVTRSGTTNRLFVNGIIVATATDSTSLSSTLPLTIARQLSTSTNDFAGYIDDLRITKGYARYTTTFTPPDAPFPTS